MKIRTILICLLLTSASIFALGDEESFQSDQKEAANELFKVISTSDSLELVEISPANFDENGHRVDASTPNTIDGYQIIKASPTHSKEELLKLGETLQHSVLEAGWGDMALCFSPHHALRIKAGNKETVVVVCFHCAQGYLKEDGKSEGFVLSSSAEDVWTRIFRSHGLLKTYRKG